MLADVILKPMLTRRRTVIFGLVLLASLGVVAVVSLIAFGDDSKPGPVAEVRGPRVEDAGAADDDPGPAVDPLAGEFAAVGLARLQAEPSAAPLPPALLDLVRGHIGSNHPPDFTTIRFVAAAPDGSPAYVVIDQDRTGLCLFHVELNGGGSTCAALDGFHNDGLWLSLSGLDPGETGFTIILVPEGTTFGDIGDDAQIQSNNVAVVFPHDHPDRLTIRDGTLQPREPGS